MSSLPVMEAFYTIQGEGFFQGTASFFIRLGGCDVGCTWCDVKESWDVNKFSPVETSTIVKEAGQNPARIAVVTGGEPLMFDLSELTAMLKSKGFRTHLETSGAYPLSGNWDWICLSPKKFKPPVEPLYGMADELKVIIYNQSDFKWAEEQALKVNPECKLYLQPEWGKTDKIKVSLVDYVKNNPKWEISLQIHKFLNIP